MAYYDVAGNELYTAYSAAGSALDDVYDVDGNLISESDPVVTEDIDLSNVEPYFVDEVRNAMAYMKSLGVHGWAHHLVVTDSHYTQNYGHSVPIVAAMQTSGYFGKVIHLGDIADSGLVKDYTKAAEEYSQFNGNMLFAIGNHDVLFDDYQTYFRNAFLSNDTDIVTTSEDIQNFNYYFDDTRHHIRYIVYAYSVGTGRPYVTDKIKSAPAGWHIVTLCHYKDLVIGYNLINIVGKNQNYVGNIVGHWHIDGKTTLFDGIYNQVLLNNDGWINDDSNYPKTNGTVNSQAITILSIHPASKTVKFYRIGIPTTLGKTWEYTYKNGGDGEGWQSGYYYTTNGIVQSYSTCYLSPKKYPAYNGNGNGLRYYVSSNTGTITEMYIIGLDANGNVLTRKTISASGGVGTFSAPGLATNTKSCLISFDTDGNIASENDIVVTSEPI